MDILVHSEGFTMYDKLREQVEDKVARIELIAPRAIRARVTLKRTSAHPSQKQYAATVLVELPGRDARAEQQAGAPLEAVDLLVEKIEHQLSKKKTERLAKRTKTPRKLAVVEQVEEAVEA